MNVWDSYSARNSVIGGSRRESMLRRERDFVSRVSGDNLSHFTVPINGVEQSVRITNTDNLDTKHIYSMPGEDLAHGGIVEWMNNHWIITERDANNEVHTRALMRQCNYLLKWVDPVEKVVMERWVLIEDGTKYLTGEYGDRDFIVARGDSRVSLTITKDEYSLRFDRNSRFIIDDYSSTEPLAYRITKPYKLGGSFDDTGVFRFVLTECNTEEDDNLELHIADYYTFFPKEKEESTTSTEAPIEERKVWF